MTRKLEKGTYFDEVGEGWLDLGGCGQMTDDLRKCPVARLNAPKAKDRVDTAHLSRYTGTNLVQWYGRKADGMFHPIGRILKLTPEGKKLLKEKTK